MKKILYRKSNSKFPNSIVNKKLFAEIKISHRIFYEKSSGFFLRSTKFMLLPENAIAHHHSQQYELGARMFAVLEIVRVYCMALSFIDSEFTRRSSTIDSEFTFVDDLYYHRPT